MARRMTTSRTRAETEVPPDLPMHCLVILEPGATDRSRQVRFADALKRDFVAQPVRRWPICAVQASDGRSEMPLVASGGSGMLA